MLTAMIVSMVLRAQEPWYVVTIASVVAVLSKYLFRSAHAERVQSGGAGHGRQFLCLSHRQSWWGALTEDHTAVASPVLVFAGVFISDRVNKLPMVLTFLGAYFLLFTVAAFVGIRSGSPRYSARPISKRRCFFAFIILTDPPTPRRSIPTRSSAAFIVACVSFAFFEWAGMVYFCSPECWSATCGNHGVVCIAEAATTSREAWEHSCAKSAPGNRSTAGISR